MCSSMLCLVICLTSALLYNLLTVLTVQYGSQARGNGHCNLYHRNHSTSNNEGMVLTEKNSGYGPMELGAATVEDGFHGKCCLCGEAGNYQA